MGGSAITASQGRNTKIDGLEVSNKSVRRASVIAGSGLLVMTLLAIFGNFVVLEGLITQGDAARTANDIMNSESMFRFGIASLFSVAVLDLIVAWALYIVFKPVSRNISLLAAWFRIVFAGIFMVAISQLVGALSVLNNAEYLAVFSTGQLHAQALLGIDAFYHIWDAALILVGLHLLLIGYLSYISGYVPKFLGVLLVVAGLGYVIDSFGLVLFAGYSVEVAAFTFVGEVLLIFWLFIKGRRVVFDEQIASAVK